MMGATILNRRNCCTGFGYGTWNVPATLVASLVLAFLQIVSARVALVRFHAKNLATL
jgi:hypothetical protein